MRRSLCSPVYKLHAIFSSTTAAVKLDSHSNQQLPTQRPTPSCYDDMQAMHGLLLNCMSACTHSARMPLTLVVLKPNRLDRINCMVSRPGKRRPLSF